MMPNPSVKRSAIGRPPSPRSAVVYPALRGLGVLPLSPAYLERWADAATLRVRSRRSVHRDGRGHRVSGAGPRRPP